MSQESKLRLVRCPKCATLLQELPVYSVYQCGGCGAFLRAKKKVHASDGAVLQKSNGENGSVNHEKLDCLPEINLSNASEIATKVGEIGNRRRNESDFRNGNVNLISNSSTAKRENKENLVNYSDEVVREQSMNSRPNQADKESCYADIYRQSSKRPIDDWVHGDAHYMNMCKSSSVNSMRGKDVAGMLSQLKNRAGSLKFRPVVDRFGIEGDGYGGFYCNPNKTNKRGGFSTYPDEGPSNSKQAPFYGSDEPMKKIGSYDEPNGVEFSEPDRAELLRKLDELRDQLSKSLAIADKFPVHRKAPPYPFEDRVSHNVSVQPVAQNNHVLKPPRPPNFSQSRKLSPLMRSHGADMVNFHPHLRHTQSEFSRYDDPFVPQILNGSSTRPYQNPKQPPNNYFLQHHRNMSQGLCPSYPQEPLIYQPACLCLHCNNKNRQVRLQNSPTVFGNGDFRKDPIGPNLYQHVDPATYGAKIYNSPANPPVLRSPDPHSHTRWSDDLESDIEGFGQRRPRRLVVARGNTQLCHPIAGAAPFITCHNCFQLLKLPERIKLMEKSRLKLKCGGCSTVISYTIQNNRLIISLPQEKKVLAASDDGICELPNKSLASSHGFSNADGTNPCSGGFDDSGDETHSLDAKQNLLSEAQPLKLSEAEKRQGLTSSSLPSREEEIPVREILQKDDPNSAELVSNDNVSPTILGSTSQQQFNDSSDDHFPSKHKEESKSGQTEQENAIVSEDVSKDVLVGTEVEVSFNEYLNTSSSHDSLEICSDKGHSRIHRGSESFLVGFMKKSFKDFSRSNHSVDNERPNVSVNGHPIPDRIVKKAEKRAGPILPGDYWYDFQGGFWGLMGQPCLGIIPPFIREFNYPMPENCSAGNTGVFVNGRELHPKDLELLADRGLPTTRNKKYIVKISGRVVDEESGQEMVTLGQLAPTPTCRSICQKI